VNALDYFILGMTIGWASIAARSFYLHRKLRQQILGSEWRPLFKRARNGHRR
jgi:hypothetical protein